MSTVPSAQPAPLRRALFFAQEQALLHDILVDRRYPPPLSNSQSWRSFNAAKICLERLFESAMAMDQTGETRERYLAHVTVTTRCRWGKQTKIACKHFRRIVEEHLAPHCRAYAWFLHRSKNGYVHWHLVADLLKPVLVADCSSQDVRAFVRMMRLSGLCTTEIANDPLTDDTQQIQANLSEACKQVGIGHHVLVEAVDNPEGLSRYVTRYLRGVAECGRRYYADKRVRLWAASRTAQAATVTHRMLIRHEARGRMKMAAWIRSRGATSFAEAKMEFGRHYAYHARDAIQKLRLRCYMTEDDFYSDWGCRFTPEALGIEIWDPAYTAADRKHDYDFETVSPEWKSRVEPDLRRALPLSREQWLRDQIIPEDNSHLSTHISNTTPRRRKQLAKNVRKEPFTSTSSKRAKKRRKGSTGTSRAKTSCAKELCPAAPSDNPATAAAKNDHVCEQTNEKPESSIPISGLTHLIAGSSGPEPCDVDARNVAPLLANVAAIGRADSG